MIQKLVIGILCTSCLFVPTMQARATLVVTQPAATTVVAAGDDYATQVLGNAWDMNDAVDVDSEESYAIANQTMGAGIFSGDTTANGSNFYPVFMGYGSTVNLSRGANLPIDTSHYRYVTYKLRVNQASQPQFTRVLGILDGGSYGTTPKPTLVESSYTAQLPNNVWTIVSFDMVTNNDTLFYHWTDFPQLTGLRIDPATTNAGGAYANVHVDVDWIRLTAPATAAQKTTVQWTDPGFSGPYSISAVDASNVSYSLGSGISGSSFLGDMSFLPPGQYTIAVARSGASANSAPFHINSPTQIAITAPSVRGEQSLNFAATVAGNAWGPIDSGDFSIIRNFTNVSYTTPSGSFYGRPTNSDSGWFINLHGQAIDANLYRSLCFKMEVFGPRSIGLGSIARLFWGNATNMLTTSQDIVLDDNLSDTLVSEYCIPDMAAAPLEPSPNGGAWSGNKTVLRLDPDELLPPGGCSTADACHDVRLDSVVLSPFARANPNYTFTWTTKTDKASVTLHLALDPDTIPGNGNEFAIYSQLVANGTGSFAWPGTGTIPSGTYHVLATVDDGVNVVNQYAGGVIIVISDDIFRDGFGP